MVDWEIPKLLPKAGRAAPRVAAHRAEDTKMICEVKTIEDIQLMYNSSLIYFFLHMAIKIYLNHTNIQVQSALKNGLKIYWIHLIHVP